MTLEPGNRRRWSLLLAVALGVRAVVSLLVLGGMPLVSDASAYARQGLLLADGLPHPAYYWPPGTSYYLAAFFRALGDSTEVARLAQIALGGISVVVTVLLARRVVKTETAAWLSGWIAALYPALILHAAQPFSYELTLVGVTGCALATIEAYDRNSIVLYGLAGAALGTAALARPGSLSLLVVLLPLAVWFLLHGSRAKRKSMLLGTVTGLGVVVLMVYPAARHNADAGEGWTLSTNNEKNLWFGNNPYTPHYLTAELGQRPESEMPPDVRSYLLSFKERSDSRDAMWTETLRYITERPDIFALRTTNRIRAFWGFEYTFSRGIQSHYGWDLARALPLYILEGGGYLIVVLLTLLALFAVPALREAPRARFCLALVAAYMLPHVVAFSAGVWHVPILGLLFPLAGSGVLVLPDAQTRRRATGSVRFWIALVLLAAVQLEYAYFVLKYQS